MRSVPSAEFGMRNAECGVADERVDRAARQARHQRGAGFLVCFLSTITASLAEAEKERDVAATPKCGVKAKALRV